MVEEDPPNPLGQPWDLAKVLLHQPIMSTRPTEWLFLNSLPPTLHHGTGLILRAIYPSGLTPGSINSYQGRKSMLDIVHRGSSRSRRDCCMVAEFPWVAAAKKARPLPAKLSDTLYELVDLLNAVPC